jgi:dipeptidyl aminopeptidase/acylaminoacyl peptidase
MTLGDARDNARKRRSSMMRFAWGAPALVALAAACDTPEPAVPAPPVAPPAASAEKPAPKAPPRADASLIPRALLFGNPDKTSPKISPDGKMIAFVAPENGVLNVWVAPTAEPTKARAVTHEKTRGLRAMNVHWAHTNKHILYRQDTAGDENWHVHAVDLDSGASRDLTPYASVAAQIVNVSHRLPKEVLVGLNDRDPKAHDLHRIDITTGKRTLVHENKDGFAEFVVDDDYKLRFGMKATAEGGMELFSPGAKGWKSFSVIGPKDSLTTWPIDFDRRGKVLYMIDSRDRDTAALVGVDTTTGKGAVLAENAKADVREVLLHPTQKTVQAVGSTYERRTWQLLDKALEADFAYLRTVAKGDIDVVSRSLDDKRWTVGYMQDDGPVQFYLYDRAKKKAELLFVHMKALEGQPLARMHPVVIKARDGLDLVSYLTLPKTSDPDGDARPDKPLPMVLFVHGGPWARDTWGYNAFHQWLANRGYAVLSVNFRGSTGFGKKFLNAGDREWGAKMHDDLVDAAAWAVASGVAEKGRVAIEGASYGGYATLVALTFTPDAFACGVDIVGPSNLVTLLNTIPPYWAPQIELFTKRIGDHRTEDGKRFLLDRSPLTHVQRIRRPLLIGQGKNDPRVKQSESDQIVKAMQDKKIPVTYVLYPDEGHGFVRPQNRMSFNAVTEVFLAQCLGGPYQPIGTDFDGSAIQVPAGADHIHGLPAALPGK